MQARFNLTRDGISPALLKKLRKADSTLPSLRAAGEVLVQMAKRSFDEPTLRPATWAPRKGTKTHQLLKKTGTLWRSLRVLGIDKTRVTVGSDRPYAGFHQLGTHHIPARPFFPVTSQGALTPLAKTRVETAIKVKLGIE